MTGRGVVRMRTGKSKLKEKDQNSSQADTIDVLADIFFKKNEAQLFLNKLILTQNPLTRKNVT
jgi:hypothetical protein